MKWKLAENNPPFYRLRADQPDGEITGLAPMIIRLDRIDQAHAEGLEIPGIAGGNGQVMDERGGRDQRIFKLKIGASMHQAGPALESEFRSWASNGSDAS